MKTINVGWQIEDWSEVLGCHDSPKGSAQSRYVYGTEEQAITVAREVMGDLHDNHNVPIKADYPAEVESRPLNVFIHEDKGAVFRAVTFEYRIVKKFMETMSVEVNGETFTKKKENVTVIQDWKQVLTPGKRLTFSQGPDESYVWKRTIHVVNVVYKVLIDESTR